MTRGTAVLGRNGPAPLPLGHGPAAQYRLNRSSV
jgi:hypothetical protein